ncbi:MAG: dcd [Parachlamydiales bacterium]|nr:dcd [Parachlamydiales bacterium]
MILTGKQITQEVHRGRIIIDPFNEECVNPNSYNFTLSDTFLVYDMDVIDTRSKNTTKIVKMEDNKLILEPWKLYLASTREKIGSNYFAPTYAASV